MLAAGGAGAVALGGFTTWRLLQGPDDAPRPEPRAAAWTYTPDDSDLMYAELTAHQHTVYLTTTDPLTVHALAARTGRLRWKTTVSEAEEDREGTAVTATDDTLYVASWAGRVTALDTRDGSRRWSSGPMGGGTPEPPVLIGSTLCALAREIVDSTEYGGPRRRAKGVVTGLDAATGRELWRHEAARLLRVHRPTGTLLADTHAGARLAALDAATGRTRWSAKAPAQVAVGGDVVGTLGEGAAGQGSESGNGSTGGGGAAARRLTVRDQATGEVRWRAPSVSEAATDPPGLTVDARTGAVYACDYTGDVRAHDLRSGKTRWRAEIEEPCAPTLVQHGAALYATSGSGYGHQSGDGGFLGLGGKSGGYVTALSARTGEPRWRTDRAETSWSLPTPAGPHAVVVAHDSDWWAYDTRTGAPRWRVAHPAKPGEPVRAAGHLHLLGDNGVHAVRL